MNAGLPGHAVNNGVLSLLLMRSAAMEYKAESADGFEEEQSFVFDYAVRPFTAADPGHAEREGERLNCPLRVSTSRSEITLARLTLRLSPDKVLLPSEPQSLVPFMPNLQGVTPRAFTLTPSCDAGRLRPHPL